MNKPTDSEAGESDVIKQSGADDRTATSFAADGKDQPWYKELQNDLRGEILDKRAAYIDRWLAVTAIVLTFFGIVVAVAGYIGFERFREIEKEAQGLVQEIKKHRDKAEQEAEIAMVHYQKITASPETARLSDKRIGKSLKNSEKKRGVENGRKIDNEIESALSSQQKGAKEEAIEKWHNVAKLAKDVDANQAARAWSSIGFLRQEDDLVAAISAYDEAIKLNPKYALAYNNRGNAKAKLEQRESALADYDEAIRLKPDYAAAYYNRGVEKAAQESFKSAIADYTVAIELKPKLAEAYTNRGIVRAQLRQYEEAIADYTAAIRLKPNDAEAYFGRGTARAALGLKAKARSDFKSAIDLARKAKNEKLQVLAELMLYQLASDKAS